MDNKCQELTWKILCSSLHEPKSEVEDWENQLVNCLLGLARLHTSWCVLHLLTPVAGVWLGGGTSVEVLLGPVQVAGLGNGWRD